MEDRKIVLELRKGARVGFEHDEVGWLEGTLVRYSEFDDAWLVRTKLGDRWVGVGQLRPPRPPLHPGHV